MRFRAKFPAQMTERDKDMGVGSSRCGNPLNLEMISVCECPLPNPGAAQAFHPQCQARRHTQVLWHWPHARPQGPDSPGGRMWVERAQTPTLGQLLLRRFGPRLPLGFHEFCANGPLVPAVMLQGRTGQRWS